MPVFVRPVPVLLLLLTACSTSPPQRYLLETFSPLSPLPEQSQIQRIGLQGIELPAYMKEDRIVSVGPENQLLIDPVHRWAEPVQQALNRSLANNLRTLLSADVLAEPFPRGYDSQLRITVSFDRLLWRRGTGVEWSGQYVLIDGDGRNVVFIQSFDIHQAHSSKTQAAYFEATSDAMKSLATLIAQSALDQYPAVKD